MHNSESYCSLPLKLKPLSVAVLMALGSAGAEAVTIQFNFDNSTTDGVQGTDFNYAACNMDFIEGREFRMCDPGNTNLIGGIPLQKDTANGSEVWDFDTDTGLMTGVTNTANTPGLSTTVKSYVTMGYIPNSIAPDGDVGLDQGAFFASNPIGFLAPTVGSAAGNLYGEGQYAVTSATTFELFFPTLEMQAIGAYFPLGLDGNNGVTFFGTTDGSNFSMWAEHTITSVEDTLLAATGSPVLSDFTAQWYYTGTLTEVPVPPAVWLLGSGLLGLVGFARRKKTV